MVASLADIDWQISIRLTSCWPMDSNRTSPAPTASSSAGFTDVNDTLVISSPSPSTVEAATESTGPGRCTGDQCQPVLRRLRFDGGVDQFIVDGDFARRDDWSPRPPVSRDLQDWASGFEPADAATEALLPSIARFYDAIYRVQGTQSPTRWITFRY